MKMRTMRLKKLRAVTRQINVAFIDTRLFKTSPRINDGTEIHAGLKVWDPVLKREGEFTLLHRDTTRYRSRNRPAVSVLALKYSGETTGLIFHVGRDGQWILPWDIQEETMIILQAIAGLERIDDETGGESG